MEPFMNQTKSGQKIFFNPKAKNGMKYITQDVGSGNVTGSHNGGVWKAAPTPQSLNSLETRTGTFDAYLNYLKE